MRVAALYDIHGNLPALQAVFSAIEKAKVDHMVVGGDVVLGPMSVECLDFLKSVQIPTTYIRGNCETSVLKQLKNESGGSFPEIVQQQISWTADSLSTRHQSMLSKWPATVTLSISGLGSVLFCHATPQNENDIFTKFTSKEKLLAIFKQVKEPTVICGHTHMQFDRQVENTRVVNAGSVGMPFGKPGAFWLLLGPDIELRHTTYDLETAAELLSQSSYPGAKKFAEKNVLVPPSEEAMVERLRKAEL